MIPLFKGSSSIQVLNGDSLCQYVNMCLDPVLEKGTYLDDLYDMPFELISEIHLSPLRGPIRAKIFQEIGRMTPLGNGLNRVQESTLLKW